MSDSFAVGCTFYEIVVNRQLLKSVFGGPGYLAHVLFQYCRSISLLPFSLVARLGAVPGAQFEGATLYDVIVSPDFARQEFLDSFKNSAGIRVK